MLAHDDFRHIFGNLFMGKNNVNILIVNFLKLLTNPDFKTVAYHFNKSTFCQLRYIVSLDVLVT